MAGVPKLFDMMRLLFQSIRRSVITKEELIHKIVAGNLDIVDRSKGLLYFHHYKENNSSVLCSSNLISFPFFPCAEEVEEQLKLLQELAPEYISEQLCLSGDILLRSVFLSSYIAHSQIIGITKRKLLWLADCIVMTNIYSFVLV